MDAMLKVKKMTGGNVCNLQVSGVLDYATMDPFVSEIRSVEPDVKQVVIDFSGLEFIDSTGIGAIINLVHEAKAKNFTVKLEGISQETGELFETIGVFEIIKTLQQEEV